MESSKILLKDGQTVDLVDGRIADGDIASWNNKLNVDGSNATNAGVTAMMKKLGSVGDASTPIYLNNGVAQEATGVNSHINDSSIHLPSVLPISRGGTGADDRTEAEYNLLGSISDSEVTDESTLDNRKIPLVNNSISITNGVFRFLSFSVIWNWIKHKLGISTSGSSTKFLNEQGEWSDTIAKARAVVDYGTTSKAIEIGWGGKSIQNPTYFAVYTDSANGYNKAIKDCSLENAKKAINGTSVGSTAVPVFINANGAPQVCTEVVSDSNPTLAWGTTSIVGTVGGKALRVTMPSNPASGMAEDFFAIVTQSTFEDAKAAYNAGKRIVGVLGGTTSGGNPFRQETPLAFVVFADNMPFAFTFLFENARPKTASGEGVGSTTIYTLSSSGWATSTDNVDYAETAGTANTSQTANKLSTVDTAPKKGSSNMVTSDGLWNDTPSPIAYYFDSTGIIGIYNDSRRADEVVIRNCGRFRLTTSWLKNFSGRTFKIHNAMSANLEISVQVEAGLKLLLTDELNSSVKTYDNTSGSSSAETRRVLFLLPGETLRLYVIYTSGTTDVALFIIGSGRWSVFSPPYDKYRRLESITRYQRFSYAKTSGSPSNKGNVHLYDGKNWHNLCNVMSSATTEGTVVIAGLDSSRTPDNPVEFDTVDGLMPIVTGLTLTRNGYMGMLYGYVAPKQSIALRLPTASSDTATSYYQSGKTLANCSELRINGFDTDAVGAGHAVFTAGSLLHITLLSGTLTFAIAGDFSVFTTGASYFFSIPLSFGNLKG